MMMLVPLVFATAPQAFVDAIHDRIASTQLHLPIDWWADDLDGDKVPEAIAEVCDDTTGFILVLHGKDLLEVPLEIDGRNNCETPPSPPAWKTRSDGVVGQDDLRPPRHRRPTRTRSATTSSCRSA